MTRDEADERLAQAIRDHAIAYDMTNVDDEMLASYAVIAHWQPIEADESSRYTIAYDRPYVPDHVARGLFATALSTLGTPHD